MLKRGRVSAKIKALYEILNELKITDYHAKYFAYELTKRCSSDSLEKLSSTLSNAQVDLNPHQIEAALFALRNPLSKGVLLADEVGLGKTIEAGLVLCQCWAERKRRLLVVCPAALRKQWLIELAEKFNLPAVVLDATACRKATGNPFETAGVVIVSMHFASQRASELDQRAHHLKPAFHRACDMRCQRIACRPG